MDRFPLDPLGADRHSQALCAPASSGGRPLEHPGAIAGGRSSPGVCTRTSRGVAAHSGAHWSQGWGSAVLLPLGLDTPYRTGYGRSRQGRLGDECSGNAGGPARRLGLPQPGGNNAPTFPQRRSGTPGRRGLRPAVTHSRLLPCLPAATDTRLHASGPSDASRSQARCVHLLPSTTGRGCSTCTV